MIVAGNVAATAATAAATNADIADAGCMCYVNVDDFVT